MFWISSNRWSGKNKSANPKYFHICLPPLSPKFPLFLLLPPPTTPFPSAITTSALHLATPRSSYVDLTPRRALVKNAPTSHISTLLRRARCHRTRSSRRSPVRDVRCRQDRRSGRRHPARRSCRRRARRAHRGCRSQQFVTRAAAELLARSRRRPVRRLCRGCRSSPARA